MNISSLESFVQQTFGKTSAPRSQSDIAASIGNAKQLQAQKMQMIQQIEQTLQQRQNSGTPRVASQPAKPSSSKDYSFSIYV